MPHVPAAPFVPAVPTGFSAPPNAAAPRAASAPPEAAVPVNPRPRWDPLTEVLLCTTAEVEPGIATHAVGTRMHRGAGQLSRRGVLIKATRDAIVRCGTDFTFADVACAAGVTEDQARLDFTGSAELMTAVMIDEVDRLVAQLAHRGLADALTQAAVALSDHPLLDALAGQPATLASLARVDVGSAGWRIGAEAIEAALSRCGKRGGPFVLRWLASFVVSPAEAADIPADVAVMVAGLPPAVTASPLHDWTDRRTG